MGSCTLSHILPARIYRRRAAALASRSLRVGLARRPSCTDTGLLGIPRPLAAWAPASAPPRLSPCSDGGAWGLSSSELTGPAQHNHGAKRIQSELERARTTPVRESPRSCLPGLRLVSGTRRARSTHCRRCQRWARLPARCRASRPPDEGGNQRTSEAISGTQGDRATLA